MRRGSKLAAAAILSTALGGNSALARALTIPFDFSRSEIGVEVSVRGQPLYMMLDTGVDPSTIDLARAETLHLKIDRNAGGEASGVGGNKHAELFPATIQGLAVGGRAFAPFAAAAMDLSALSARYGRRLDGILGFSFLNGRIVLFDYPAHQLSILDRASDANPASASCRSQWSAPLRLLKGENWPLLSNFRIGGASATVTLDTGSSGLITLYNGAMVLPGVRAALVRKGKASSSGFRGSAALVTYALGLPLGFGPFALSSGELVTLRDTNGSTVLANVGNRLFAEMKVKMLLDYRTRTMTFFGSCS